MQPRAYTKEETQKQFIEHIKFLIGYWEKAPDVYDTKEKLEGLAFSILASLDGASPNIPGMIMIPISDEDTIKDRIENDLNYYPCPTDISENDIAGNLHSLFHSLPTE